ncbi:MAG: response regulator [Rhodospirillales bacterium]|jgi:two-component system, chemotaxis family, chemotaxis protein CheY|nr:response regulator [Rhodospirillales bacterium]
MTGYNQYDYTSTRVLLIDDEPFIRKLIIRLLFDIGIKGVVEAENGLHGVKKLQESKRGFDFIICDLEMPDLNGLEFLKTLRKGAVKEFSDTPVIILTGHSDEDNIYEAVMLGIHGFLTKPVSRNDLEAKVVASLTGNPIDSSRLRRK